MKNWKTDYQKLLLFNEQCEYEIKRMIQKHRNDRELYHPIGEDPYCLYCEQYNEVSEKARIIRANIQEFEETHPVASPLIENVPTEQLKSIFSVYNVCLRDGVEFLLYSDSPESCVTYLKKETSEIANCTQIPKDYYGSIYLETSSNTIATLARAIRGLPRRPKVLAEKAQTQSRGRGLCYNDIPFEFFKYSQEKLSALQTFCGPNCPIIKTKKFPKTGRIGIQNANGMCALENGQVLLKITDGILLPLSKEAFEKNFSEDESLVWIQK